MTNAQFKGAVYSITWTPIEDANKGDVIKDRVLASGPFASSGVSPSITITDELGRSAERNGRWLNLEIQVFMPNYGYARKHFSWLMVNGKLMPKFRLDGEVVQRVVLAPKSLQADKQRAGMRPANCAWQTISTTTYYTKVVDWHNIPVFSLGATSGYSVSVELKWDSKRGTGIYLCGLRDYVTGSPGVIYAANR